MLLTESQISMSSQTETRKRAREEVDLSRKRRRKSKFKSSSNEDDETLRIVNTVDRKNRWMTLLHFDWNKDTADRLIRFVFKDDVNSNELNYDWVWRRLDEHNHQYKSKIIKHMIVSVNYLTISQFSVLRTSKKFVRQVKRNEIEKSDFIIRFSNIDMLNEFFVSLFNQKNFCKVFYFMNNYIDVSSSKSSDLNDKYLKDMHFVHDI